MKWLSNLDLQNNELQNFRIQNLATAPETPYVGQHYYNTVANTEYVWNGTAWIDALSQGDYTFQNGIELASGTRNVQLKLATGNDAGNVTLSADAKGLAANVAEASTSAKGIIEIATDSEAATGTAEDLAVNPKQLAAAVDGDIELTDLSIASGSANYLEYDNTNGQFGAKVDANPTKNSTKLVTSGGVFGNTLNDVSLKNNTTDTLSVTKGDVTTDVKIEKVDKAIGDEDGNNIKSTYATKDEVKDTIELTDLSIASTSANYLEYDNTTGEFGAKVSTSITDNDTNLVTGEAVYEAIKDHIELTDLSIESGSANYLTYDNTTGEIGANVSTTITDNDTNLVTGDAVHEAIKDHIALTDLSVDAGSANYAEYDNTTGELTIKAAQANGLATLDANGTVPASQLPSYVDDVINVKIAASAPATCAVGDLYYNSTSKKIFEATAADTWAATGTDPEAGKIYINTENNMSYRWSGTDMVQIGADKLLGYNGVIEGDGTTTSFTITHNLGTRNVVFEIYEAVAPFEKVYVQVNHTSTSAVQVVFAQAPAEGTDYNITVIAIG